MRFDRAAASFDSADFVHAHTRQELFARLEPVVIDAKVVLDLGCATGAATTRLAKIFRGARIIGVDLSGNMLDRCGAGRGLFRKPSFVQADACMLPFANHSVDVVFSNLLLPWIDDPSVLGRELARVLRKGGLFVFSSLGPDSLAELRQAWADVDDYEHVNRFLDMHDLGDALVRAGLLDPILDVDRLTVTYDSSDKLFHDLGAVGARNSLQQRQQTLSGKTGFQTMQRRLASDSGGGKLRLDLELVFGHCWGSGRSSKDGDVHIDPGAIPIRRG